MTTTTTSLTLTDALNAGTAHAGHAHPATKAARAKCRRDAKAREAARREEITQVINSYYSNEGEADEIINSLAYLIPGLNLDRDIEEIVSDAASR